MRAEWMRMAWRVVGGIASLAMCSVALSQGVRYEVVPLENIFGSLGGYDITDLGVITGSYQEKGPGSTFILSGGNLSVLPRLPGSTSNWGLRINNNNAVVGRAIVGLDYHSVLWLDGKPIDLGMTYDESGGDSATDLNDSLQISAYTDGRPAVWEAGKVSFLPVPTGSGTAGALGINNVGDVVGSVHMSGDLKAAKWVEGVYHNLHPTGYHDSRAKRIADNGDVGGDVEKRPGSNTAALWKANGEFTDLGVPSSFGDLNSNGQVVGVGVIHGVTGGFVWDNGEMSALTDLVPPGWTIVTARGINDKGQILASGSFGIYSGAILLNPVPEPATILVTIGLLLGLGLRNATRQQR